MITVKEVLEVLALSNIPANNVECKIIDHYVKGRYCNSKGEILNQVPVYKTVAINTNALVERVSIGYDYNQLWASIYIKENETV